MSIQYCDMEKLKEQWRKANKKYREKNKHLCLDCKSKILKVSIRCASCNMRFIQRGKKRTDETKKKMSKVKEDHRNRMWVGENVGYNGLHSWIRRRLKKPEICPICKIRKPYDLSNISGEYKRDINDFEWLCRKCHMESDGRLKNLKNNKK